MIYAISDTHFGHKMLQKAGYREEGFEEDIIKKWNLIVTPLDTVIHCGDWSLGTYGRFSLSASIKKWRDKLNGNVILVKGNHDRHCEWYINNGFQFCANRIEMKYRGIKLVFTHRPVRTKSYVNVHGHIHSDMRVLEHNDWYDNESPYHINVAVDHTDLKPISLKAVINMHLKRVGRVPHK